MPAIPQVVACMLFVIIRPTKQQSAEKICSTDDRSVGLYALMGPSTVGKMVFQVVCNEQKNAIKRCILKSSDDLEGGMMFGLRKVPADGFPASSGPTKFGGEFGNKYEVDCSETEAPKSLKMTWFSEQVCNTLKQSTLYEVDGIPKPFNVQFFCNAAKTLIESCKPEGGGKIKAGAPPGKFGGSYKLKCNDQNPPKFQLA